MTTASQVKSAAQLERLRLATQAAQARAAAGAQARQAEGQTAAQARQAISETEQQAQAARSEAQREAESRQAEIRKQRGQAEREAEAAKSSARETQKIEQRKVVLPVTRPRGLGLTSYISNVETARKQAHQAGESAKVAVTKVRDDYFGQVDKARDDAIADINKQKAGINADIQAQLVNINADITKQLANLNSGVNEWEADSKAKIAKAQADYAAVLKTTLPPTQQSAITSLENAGFVTDDGKGNYTINVKNETGKLADIATITAAFPGLGTPQISDLQAEHDAYTQMQNDPQAYFKRLQDDGTVPAYAVYKDIDTKTGQVNYEIPAWGTIGIDKIRPTNAERTSLTGQYTDLMPDSQAFIAQAALGRTDFIVHDTKDGFELLGIRGKPSLSADDKDRVLAYYKEQILASDNPTQAINDLYTNIVKAQSSQLKSAAIGMIPVYGTIWNWGNMSPAWRAISIAMDVAFIVPFISAGVSALKAIPVLRAAKGAGSAATNMGNALRILAKTPMDDVARYTKASSTASKAIQASKVADAKFVTALERVKALTPRQLTKLEKVSQIKGLKNAIMDLSNAQAKLKKAWEPLTTYRLDLRAGASTLEERAFMGSKGYVKRMARVERAQTALNKAIETFNTKLEPRFKVNPTPEFKGFALEWRKKIVPTMEGGEPVAVPLGGTGKGKQLMVLEKTKPKLKLKTSYELKMKPAYETAEEVTKKVVAPAVKAGSTAAKVAVATSVATKEATKVERDSRWWTGSKPAQRIIEQGTTIAIGKVMNAVTGKTGPVTATEWNTERVVRQIIQDAIDTGLDASTRDMPAHGLRNLVYNQIQGQVNTITSPQLKAQLQTQVSTITDLATKIATKVATKIATKVATKAGGEDKKSTKEEREYPAGTIAWKMGETKRGEEYKIIPPPYTMLKPISSKYPPKGMTKTKGTPQETLTFIGGKVPFENVSFDLGVTDGFIDVKAKTIKFTGQGQKTNVGTRIGSTTRGVALKHNPPLVMGIKQAPARTHRGRLTSHGVYADKSNTRITRKPHRGWKRIY